MAPGRKHHWIFQVSHFNSPRISFSLRPIIPVALITAFTLFCIPDPEALAQTGTDPSKKPHASELFERSVQLRTALEGKPKRLRTPAEYVKTIAKYRSVYYQFPTSSQADDALVAVAELYQLMGVDLKDSAYFLQAIKAYAFLEKEYPASLYRAESLFAAAEIYLNDLKDPKTAQEVFREFLKKYPHSKKSRNARARLDDLREQSRQAKKSTRQPASSAVAASVTEALPRSTRTTPDAEPATRKESALTEDTAANLTRDSKRIVKTDKDNSPPATVRVTKPASLPVILTDVRFWNTEEYTRLIINTVSEVNYQEGRLENPPRLFLDIQNSRLSIALSGRVFSLDDSYLSKIRFGQPQDHVTRVVLDLGKIKSYQVAKLSNPARIVIDLAGPPRRSQPTGSTASNTWKIKHGEPLADELNVLAPRTKGPEPASPPGNEEMSVATIPRTTETKVPASTTAVPKPRIKKDSEVALKQTAEKTGAKNEAPTVSADHEKESKAMVPARTALPRSDGTRSLIRTLGLKIGRIVIDAGHGGHDTGTIGPSGLQEKDLVLDVALKLKQLLEDRLGSEVILTRGDDTFVPLEERTAIANQSQADLFISIHANSSRNRYVSGVETFFLDFASSADVEEIAARENASAQKTVFELQDLVQKIALREKVDESREFAQIVQKSIAGNLQKTRRETKDRGVKQAPFIVLIGANMPSILSEISFVSNPTDEKLLKSQNYRQKVAEALCHGIESYAGGLGGIRTAKNVP